MNRICGMGKENGGSWLDQPVGRREVIIASIIALGHLAGSVLVGRAWFFNRFNRREKDKDPKYPIDLSEQELAQRRPADFKKFEQGIKAVIAPSLVNQILEGLHPIPAEGEYGNLEYSNTIYEDLMGPDPHALRRSLKFDLKTYPSPGNSPEMPVGWLTEDMDGRLIKEYYQFMVKHIGDQVIFAPETPDYNQDSKRFIILEEAAPKIVADNTDLNWVHGESFLPVSRVSARNARQVTLNGRDFRKQIMYSMDYTQNGIAVRVFVRYK